LGRIREEGRKEEDEDYVERQGVMSNGKYNFIEKIRKISGHKGKR